MLRNYEIALYDWNNVPPFWSDLIYVHGGKTFRNPITNKLTRKRHDSLKQLKKVFYLIGTSYITYLRNLNTRCMIVVIYVKTIFYTSLLWSITIISIKCLVFGSVI